MWFAKQIHHEEREAVELLQHFVILAFPNTTHHQLSLLRKRFRVSFSNPFRSVLHVYSFFPTLQTTSTNGLASFESSLSLCKLLPTVHCNAEHLSFRYIHWNGWPWLVGSLPVLPSHFGNHQQPLKFDGAGKKMVIKILEKFSPLLLLTLACWYLRIEWRYFGVEEKSIYEIDHLAIKLKFDTSFFFWGSLKPVALVFFSMVCIKLPSSQVVLLFQEFLKLKVLIID